MTTLQAWKDKLIEILSDDFYQKTEIDTNLEEISTYIDNNCLNEDITNNTITLTITYEDDTSEDVTFYIRP